MVLKRVENIYDFSLTEKIEDNIIGLFDWGFLDKGGYINIDINQSGAYIDNRSTLRRSVDPRTGEVQWQGEENWVYESGTEVGTPNSLPQVYVNNTLDATALVNYKDGYVTVTNSNPSSVKAQYSYKWVTCTSAKRSGVVRRVSHRHARQENDNILRDITIPLPFVAFETLPINDNQPYGLGLFSPRILYHTTNAYIVSDQESDVIRIADAIAKQKGFIFELFDPESVQASGDFPLTYEGYWNSGKSFPQLVNDHPWNNFQIVDAFYDNGAYISEEMFQGVVKIRTKFVNCSGK